ncbi:hypothetical protein D3C76_377890 [compost metagenome]
MTTAYYTPGCPAAYSTTYCLEAFLAWVKQRMDSFFAKNTADHRVSHYSRQDSLYVTSFKRSEPEFLSASVTFNPAVTSEEVDAVVSQAYTSLFALCLNEHSASRVAMLLQCKEGWDGYSAKPLDHSSLQAATFFLLENGGLAEKAVGVFMNSDGELILNWPINANDIVELTFSAREVSIYVDGMDDRVVYAADDPNFTAEIRKYI